ncbi:MAG: transcriptional regulator [Bacteroidia bacterium]|nr:transcriptional regulator [Bacteroidia bacterium]
MQADPEPDTDEAGELELLAMLTNAYERVKFPVPPPHPIEAIQFQIEQMGLSTQEVTRIFGSRSRKYEVLSGKRKLSIDMIRRLHEQLRIPAEILIQSY